MSCKDHSQHQSWDYVAADNEQRIKNESEVTKSDINKLNSFIEFPEKYARGTSVAKEKVKYLDSIKNKFNQAQLAGFTAAYRKYLAEMLAKKESSVVKKVDYSSVLMEAFNAHRSVKIRYKGSWRTIDPYLLNTTYVSAYCHLARDMRTFRIDRIQGAELSEGFSFDKSLQSTAQAGLSKAPSYKYGKYRRY